MNYKLIHIDTLEVTMCEKYTFGGHDYYMKGNYQFRGGAAEHLYHIMLNSVATTNPNTGCPQVVDYVFHKWKNRFNEEEKSMGNSHLYDHSTGREAFFWGYESHSETHSFSDEEVCMFAKFALENVLYEDDNKKLQKRSFEELLTLFKLTLPTKVYYR